MKSYGFLNRNREQHQSAAVIETFAQHNEILVFKNCEITYQGKQAKLVVVKKVTPIIKLKKLKIEKKFLEMLTATVSHDMRTPLNAI